MRGLLAALALAASVCGSARAQAVVLTGGSFEMRKHAVGSVAMGQFSVGAATLTFNGGVTARYAAQYPLTDGSARRLYPYPGGMLQYLAAADNLIAGAAATVTLPRASVPEDFDFFVTDPQTVPFRADSSALAAATARLKQTAGPQAELVLQSVSEFNLLQDSGAFYDANLANLATVSLDYADADGDGIVDGSNPPIRAKTLAVYVLDEQRALWSRLPSSVDASARRVTATTPHFSVYALIGTADDDVGAVYAFPVPWAPNSGDPDKGTLAGGITFTNLPSQGTVAIYTPSGQLVRELSIPAGLFPPSMRWDVRTSGGQDVVSGVYLWRVKAGKNSKLGKLVVVR